MYQIYQADLYHLKKGKLEWELYIHDEYPTEKDAYEKIGRVMQGDYEYDCLGQYVYKVVRK